MLCGYSQASHRFESRVSRPDAASNVLVPSAPIVKLIAKIPPQKRAARLQCSLPVLSAILLKIRMGNASPS